MALLAGLATVVGVAIAAAAAWPDNWWPRHPPELKVYVKGVGGGGSFAVPSAPSALDKPPPEVKFHCSKRSDRWIKSLGGVPLRTYVDFVLTTEQSESVVIIGLTPHVKRIMTSKMKTTVSDCVGGNGYFGRSAELEVDTHPPRVRLFDETGPIKRIGLNLGKGDAADFHIEAGATTPGAVYEWTVDLELLVGGERKSVTVSDGGKPFKLAGSLPDSAPQVDLSKKLKDGADYCYDRPNDPLC
ncbi:hypothetical protein [Streptomyces sp. NPDC054940]